MPPAPTWTGFYIGANGGYGWKDPTVSFAPNDLVAFAFTCGGNAGSTCPPPASFNIGGGLGGLQAGYNWQVNQQWLLGFETDFDLSGIRGTGTSDFLMAPFAIPPGTSNFVATENVKWFGTVRGRLGFLPSNNVLIYTTGGLAYGRVDQNVSLNNNGGLDVGAGGHSFDCGPMPVGCFVGASSQITVGWTAGAGLEYALGRNFSLKAEYLYVNLDRGKTINVVAQNVFAPGDPHSSFSAAYSRVDFNVLRVGMNYQFH
jgi:outer membrane immunogenic protein